jgi:hypothetical protein
LASSIHAYTFLFVAGREGMIMTSHELAKKLLEMPDIAVVLDDSKLGDMSVSCIEKSNYDYIDDAEPVIRLRY